MDPAGGLLRRRLGRRSRAIAVDRAASGRPSLDTLRRTLRRGSRCGGSRRSRLDDDRRAGLLEHHARGRVPLGPAAYPGIHRRRAYLERTFGCWTFDGGFAELVTALRHPARRTRGSTVRLGAEVIAVETSGGAVTGSPAGRRHTLDADVVVSDLDPRTLYERAGGRPGAGRVRSRVLGTTTPARRTWSHLGLRDPLPACPSRPCCTATRRSCPGRRHRARRASGLVRAGARVSDPPTRRPAHRPRRRHRTPRGEPAYLATVAGGAAWDGARTALRRAANVRPIRGLYCVGSGAHPGGGVPATTLGAALVAAAVGKA